jgi:hypothetical protein
MSAPSLESAPWTIETQWQAGLCEPDSGIPMSKASPSNKR